MLQGLVFRKRLRMYQAFRNPVRRIGEHQLRPAQEPAHMLVRGGMEDGFLRLEGLHADSDGVLASLKQVFGNIDLTRNPSPQDGRRGTVDPHLSGRVQRFHPENRLAESPDGHLRPQVEALARGPFSAQRSGQPDRMPQRVIIGGVLPAFHGWYRVEIFVEPHFRPVRLRRLIFLAHKGVEGGPVDQRPAGQGRYPKG